MNIDYGFPEMGFDLCHAACVQIKVDQMGATGRTCFEACRLNDDHFDTPVSQLQSQHSGKAAKRCL